MKIIALQAENIKKLVAVEIKPDGNMVQITGKNGQGKTSILDSIWWALAGTSNIQGAPIRKGQKEARIRLDLGEIVVTRTFREKEDGATSSITVENAKGARFTSPQAMLDELLGQLSFDPLAFARMAPAEQFDTLKKFVPGIDFDQIETQNKIDYAKRTDINRRAKEAKTLADRLAVPPDTPDEPIDESALVAQMETAGKHNADIEARKARRIDYQNQIKAKMDGSDVLQRQIEEARKRLDELEAATSQADVEIEDMKKKLAAAPELPKPIDTSEIKVSISQAHEINQAVGVKKQQEAQQKAAEALEIEAEGLTEAMERRDTQKQEAIAAAKLPVDGIGFGDGVILLDGVPFDQASDAEQLRASIAIAMSLNPKLKVIRVRDGSLLDDDSMKLLSEMADSNDFQIWVERVDGSGKVGFVLEDGHLKAAEKARVAA
jgi:DNA repair exonuclease SbcCD ATPase subunit